jgi:hypothetical protein
MKRTHTLASLALVTVLFITGVAHATVVVPLSLADQAQRADLIVRARVGAQHSAYVPERGAILTWTDLEVTETLAGQAVRTLTLRQMGGTADGQTMQVPGDAHLAPGEDVVLFLRQEGDTVFLLALAQSAYVVDGAYAHRDLSQLTFAVLGQDGMQLAEPGREAPVALDALLAEIRRAVGGAR